MKFEYLKISMIGAHIAHVRLARPPANAVDRSMYMEVAAFFRHPEHVAEDLRVILLSGDGKHFCAGNDLDEFATMTPDNGTERMWRVREAFFAIQECPVPVVGAVHGAALGTGLCLAASCDIIVAADNALFGLPEMTVGVMGGARHLARIAPQPVVRRLYFTGQPLSAVDFAAAGGAVITCPADELLDRASTLAERIAGFSPTALRLSKRILNEIEEMGLQAGYALEQRYTVMMSGHSDAKDALNAVREKRTAQYPPAKIPDISF